MKFLKMKSISLFFYLLALAAVEVAGATIGEHAMPSARFDSKKKWRKAANASWGLFLPRSSCYAKAACFAARQLHKVKARVVHSSCSWTNHLGAVHVELGQRMLRAPRQQVLIIIANHWGKGEHVNSNRQHDKQSDLVEAKLGGLCKDCMVLQARADITDKDGKKLSLSDQVYTHHIVVTDMDRSFNMAPFTPGRGSCSSGRGGMPGLGGFGMMGSPKGSNPTSQGHGTHQKRSPQRSGGFGGLSGAMKFSMFIAKGNEGDASIFAPLNSSSPVKSGYWIGKNDVILGMGEVINYKTVPRQVYLTIDYEYIPVNGARPAEYLDVSFGTVMVEQCGSINLRMFSQMSSLWSKLITAL
jgi:Fe-S cluster biogenesis protein NfuA